MVEESRPPSAWGVRVCVTNATCAGMDAIARLPMLWKGVVDTQLPDIVHPVVIAERLAHQKVSAMTVTVLGEHLCLMPRDIIRHSFFHERTSSMGLFRSGCVFY